MQAANGKVLERIQGERKLLDIFPNDRLRRLLLWCRGILRRFAIHALLLCLSFALFTWQVKPISLQGRRPATEVGQRHRSIAIFHTLHFPIALCEHPRPDRPALADLRNPIGYPSGTALIIRPLKLSQAPSQRRRVAVQCEAFPPEASHSIAR